MKKLALMAVVLVGSLLAADSSGTYKGTGGIEDVKYGSVPQTAQLTLIQAGSTVSGTLKIANGPLFKISSGTVSGNQITFAVGAGGGTGSLTVVSATQLQGKLTSVRGEIFDVSFTKQ